MLSLKDLETRKKHFPSGSPTMEWAYICIEGKYEEIREKNRELRRIMGNQNAEDLPNLYLSEIVLTKSNGETMLLSDNMCISMKGSIYKIHHFLFSGRDDKSGRYDKPNPPSGISCIEYNDVNGFLLGKRVTLEGYNLDSISIVRCPGPLIINDAPHIGELRLNLAKQFPDGNAVSYEPFVSGNDYARLEKNNHFIFEIDSLQTYFNTGKRQNPLTNNTVEQDDIERFTYIEDLSKGGKRNRKTRQRKTRQRKSIKRRKH